MDEPRKRDTEHLVFKPQPEKRGGKGEAPAIALIGACPALNRYLDCQVGSTQSLLQLAFHKSGHLDRPLARIGRRSIGADGLTGQLVKSRACLEKRQRVHDDDGEHNGHGKDDSQLDGSLTRIPALLSQNVHSSLPSLEIRRSADDAA